jgi:hypothetical protein
MISTRTRSSFVPHDVEAVSARFKMVLARAGRRAERYRASTPRAMKLATKTITPAIASSA